MYSSSVFSVTCIEFISIMSRLANQRSLWATRIPRDGIPDMSLADINNPFNRFSLLLSDNAIVIQWLQKVGLLAANVKCDRCDVDCRLSVRDRVIDGFVCNKFTVTPKFCARQQMKTLSESLHLNALCRYSLDSSISISCTVPHNSTMPQL